MHTKYFLTAVVIGVAVLVPSHAYAAKTKISLIEPKGKTITVGNKIPVSWKITNIPKEPTFVDVQIHKITQGSYLDGLSAGGGFMFPVAKKKTGGFKHSTGGYGEGTAPGTYEVTARVRGCHPTHGCMWNVDFPGQEVVVKTYATATPIQFTLVKKRLPAVVKTTGATLLAPLSGSYKVGQRMDIIWLPLNLPQNAQTCSHLESQSDFKMYTFPTSPQGNFNCHSAQQGVEMVSGTVIRNAGYNLASGTYKVILTTTLPPAAGKDGPTIDTEIGPEITIE